MRTTIQEYIARIQQNFQSGKATEHTYRSSLEWLIESLGKGVDASNDPKHISCGAPDFIVEKGKVPLGYIETKDIGTPLDKIEKTEQMKRYLKALNNLLLTDYLEFRWYVNGIHRQTIKVAEIGKNDHLLIIPHGQTAIEQLFSDFFATEAPTVSTPKELAIRLAGVTHFIKEQTVKALDSGDPQLQKALEQQYKTFKDLLLPALKPEEFADLYAQAISYGLFAAKLSAPENSTFTLEDAYKYLRGNPFLRRLFLDVNEQLDEIEIIRPYLQDLVSLLNRADFPSILADFGKRTRTEDPVVHFYETFLAAYDPHLRKSRGVYYTPEPVVQFIVRAVDDILKTRFNKPWGLADPSVKVLDPATGTGTFLFYVIKQVYEEIIYNRKQAGIWEEQSKQLLQRLYGFELLIAPYVVAHLKLGFLLQSLGVKMDGKDERLHVYLTNALEEGIERADQLAGLGLNIAQESSEAARVKRDDDIMVVLGNPPYSGHSFNASLDKNGNPNFIGKLVREYYFIDGVPLKEKNPKWLQDDYVKFIRFGEWRITKTGFGIMAFITNHGYLDNPTFRGMRQHLLNSFDEIFILDLHGNSKKKEQSPDGSKDENVFDIQQGVAILLAIKNSRLGKADQSVNIEEQKIKHSDFFGSRSKKYNSLQNNQLKNVEWVDYIPKKPFFQFKPQNQNLESEFNKGWKITEVFPMNVTGIFTARDSLAIKWSQQEIFTTIKDFVSLPIETARQKYNLGKDVRDWKVELAQKDITDSGIDKKYITPIYYRPFDVRYTYYTGKSRGLICMPRGENFHRMFMRKNLAMGIGRQNAAVSQETWNLLIAFDMIPDLNAFRRGGIQAFPLYKFTSPEKTKGTLFEQIETTREVNLNQRVITELSQKIGLQYIPDGEGNNQTTFGPEDVFYYTYAVLHSPTYRKRYAEFLKIDFPRLPLTSNPALFATLARLGERLVAFHLLRTPEIDEFITTYPQAGSNQVERVQFLNGKVIINNQQYFDGIPEDAWDFKIGGYQVCEKWLKDRKGHTLSGEEIRHYQRVVVALQQTIYLMDEIDKTIPSWPIE